MRRPKYEALEPEQPGRTFPPGYIQGSTGYERGKKRKARANRRRRKGGSR